jgi:GH15 family glucan-1,4-alpha-glucosidase
MTDDRGALRALGHASVALIEDHQHHDGAWPASPTFAVYRYSWFRDGAFIADAMSRAGRAVSAERFFGWCSRVIVERADHILELVARGGRDEHIALEEFLPARFTLDGREGEEEWWDFQLDGYGTWLWALLEHAGRHRCDLRPYRDAIELTARYLCQFWDRPCYDWWEEHAEHRHPSTLAAVHAGLRAAAGSDTLDTPLADRCREVAAMARALVLADGVHDGHLVKWIGDGAAVDGSLIACITPLGFVDPRSSIADHTYGQVLQQLTRGGVYRYRHDTYYGGGEWLPLAGFLGMHEARIGRPDLALRRLKWMASTATPDGWLPEQVSRHVLAPEQLPAWEQKWGAIATPLLWSHAMYVTLAVELGVY